MGLMDAFLEDWEHLNPEQQQAVTTINGNHLVLAPAGTGKTKVIAMRTAYLMQQGIAPEHILNLTFTNKAAREMETRIAQYAPGTTKKLIIRTFHSFCYYLINHEKENTHFSFPCSIIDESDTVAILQRIIKALTQQNYKAINDVVQFIENVKKHSLTFPLEMRSNYTHIVKDYDRLHPIKDPFLTTYGLQILKHYQKYLRQNNSLDFTDLIVEATYLLEVESIRQKWQHRFTYIQIDEMQDTSVREYYLITLLAKANQIALFGDFNQTIYEWRGSQPTEMITLFKKDFDPTELTLTANYRSTQMLLKAANNYIRNSQLYPLICDAKMLEIGHPIEVIQSMSEQEEMCAIAQSVQNLLSEGEKQIAVLTRLNNQAKKLSTVFTKQGIPCIQVEDIRLFRKKEIKDIQALFSYAINRRNSLSLEKILNYPIIHMPEWLLLALKKTQRDFMALHDWFLAEDSDPYHQLFKAYDANQLIILDVESTGLDTTQEDIIQIAAIRYGKQGVTDKLDILLKPTKPVGTSYYVHGFTDEQLQKEGVSPTKAFKKLSAFMGESVLVGHNIKYDLQIIQSMLTRYNEPPLTYWGIYDTLDLACKVYPQMPNHKLDTLAQFVGTKHAPNHNAYYDILATGEVLEHLMEKIAQSTANRLAHLEAYYAYIHDYKTVIVSIVDTVLTQTTYDTIEYFMNDCGMKAHYTKEEVAAVRAYFKTAKALYDDTLSIQDNIIKLLSFSALHYSEIEQSTLFKDKIPIMTIHQAKGLEFDHVYMMGCNEGIFPLRKSVEEGLLAEEKRLFYVGMTRARKNLYLTYHTRKKMSFFVEDIGEDFKKYSQYKK